MPAQLTELKIRGVRRQAAPRRAAGRRCCSCTAPAGVPQWLPFFDALAERYEVLVPEHPGFGGSDDPPWITLDARPRDVLSRPRRGSWGSTGSI